MKKIAIFASGSGTNAQNIAEYFKNKPFVKVALILSNRPDAYVLKRAETLGIHHLAFNRKAFYESNRIPEILKFYQIDFIVLAGFLWLIPDKLLQAYPNRIVNIHPALLPKYGGRGMYGDRVHEAVVGNNEKESGISIHYVNEKYDEGQIIFQAKCPVEQDDTPVTLAQKVHKLEYEHYPKVIEELIKKPE
ncbi:MAG: phosphoribosylglycinamide formyltransferase [Bacteroidales bacterium]|nr:phosphoribosylglycinamide formyltransferase [Bacteroidales bacterium]MCF8234884.1 phosphoribosylglycinamide formyltransferase [Bacteroidales bacterium]MCF8344658.1 phosphoribosylglycinamide formyltransferase [Bacteroidales bacterium]MCF8350465.1 phosphoribosylglycinamide formyltransferase [Bacteroidales bacterium]MCF8376214.1 phosphoribosylglycinamide formyltransferase [Bacteroidales bacterium]